MKENLHGSISFFLLIFMTLLGGILIKASLDLTGAFSMFSTARYGLKNYREGINHLLSDATFEQQGKEPFSCVDNLKDTLCGFGSRNSRWNNWDYNQIFNAPESCTLLSVEKIQGDAKLDRLFSAQTCINPIFSNEVFLTHGNMQITKAVDLSKLRILVVGGYLKVESLIAEDLTVIAGGDISINFLEIKRGKTVLIHSLGSINTKTQLGNGTLLLSNPEHQLNPMVLTPFLNTFIFKPWSITEIKK